MEMNFFQSLLFGFVSGLTEILPVSAQAHKTIMLTIYGTESEPVLMRLLIHGAMLAALYYCCRTQIRRISRQLNLAKIPKRRRKRPLDVRVLMDYRLLRTMVIPIVICWLFCLKTRTIAAKLSWIALLSLVNALILFLPSLLPTGNKDSRMLSSVEGALMGIGGGAGVLPGISSMGGMLSVASVCGVEKVFALDLALMAEMVVVGMMLISDLVGLVSGLGALSFSVLLGYLAAAAAAYCGVFLGAVMMRGLVKHRGYHAFAFYSLAAALLSFIFYLMV